MARRKFSNPKRGKGFKKRRAMRKSKGVLSTVGKSLSPLPQRYITKMKYMETITTSALGDFQFRLNSIYDPNFTGVGHQPYGFDQLSAIYNRYRVISCGYRIASMNVVSGNGVRLGAVAANEVMPIANFDVLGELPRAKYVNQAQTSDIVVLKGKSYLPSLMGRTKAQYMADDRYQAEVSTNPAEGAVLNLYTATSAGVGVSRELQVLLEFTVEFFDAKILAQS